MKKNTQLLKNKVYGLGFFEVLAVLLFSIFLPISMGYSQSYTYTGAVQTVTLPAGDYEIEMWGADGGGTTGTNSNAAVAKLGGKGGYAKGTLTLTATSIVNIYVGGKGATEGLSVPGGFNGGGTSGGGTGVSGVCGSGGGASDIRIGGTALTDRKMVAGGGGAAGYQECNGSANAISGGHGGGLIGGTPIAASYADRIGHGGTQTAGGAGGSNATYAAGGAGSFGLGGNGGTATSGGNGAGGGGGWYGGGAGSHGFYCAGGGGGGSSYIGGVTGGITMMYGDAGFVPNPDPVGNGTVVITSMAPCTGTPTAGIAQASESNTCPTPFNLSLTGATTGGGITYQWQSSLAGANSWSDISGANGVFYTVSNPTTTMDYRCIVTCTNTNSSATSNVVTVIIKAVNQCYCTPTYTYVCTSSSENVNSFILVGENGTSINDLDTACSPGNYKDGTLTFNPVDLLQDGAYPVQFNTNYSSGSSVYATIWIDFNDNGIFDASEKLIADVPMVTTPGLASAILNIPASAAPGVHRMRIRSVYSTSNIDPCANLSWGETHDYEVNVIAVSCYRPLIASVTKASATSVNVNLTPNALNTGTVTYDYEVRTSGLPGSGASGLVTSGTATSVNFTIPGLQAGLVYMLYVRTDCGSNDYSGYSSYEFGIPASLPYTQDFEGQQHGWVLSNSGAVNEWVVDNAVSSSGTKSLYISNDQGVSNSYTINTTTVVHAYKDFEIPTGVLDVSISFDWRAMAESCCDYIRVWVVPSTFKPTGGAQITAATGRFNLFGNLNQEASFRKEEIIQAVSSFTGTFRVVFEWRNDGSVGTPPAAAIDNIEIKPVTCYRPTAMVLSNIKHNAVTVTLTPDTKNTGSVTYEYEVRTSGTPGSGAAGRVDTGTSTNPVFTISNLPPDTDYQIYVRTKCGGSDNSLWRSGAFKTLELLVIDVSKVDINCYGADNGSISVIASGGITPYTYLWMPINVTTSSVSNLAPGAYNLKVEDASGQIINQTITILEPTPVLSNLTFVSVSCNGLTDGTASVNPSGGVGPYTVLWSDNTVGPNKNNLAPGTYSVTIRDANNCVLTESFTIAEPSVLTSVVSNQTNVTTYGGNDGSATLTVAGGTAPYTYAWSPSGGTGASASNLIAGTYTVLITDARGCTTTQTVVITQPAPPYDIVLVSKDDISCNGANDGSITVNVTGGTAPYTYLWSTPLGGNSPSVSNLSAGVYTLTVTDADNTIITKDFTILEPAVLTANTTKVDINCSGQNNGTATVTAAGGTAPYTYLWSNGMTTATATNLQAGSYSVTVTDAKGCTVNASVSITQGSLMTVVGTKTDISCYGANDGSIVLNVTGGSSPYTYSWSNAATSQSIANLIKGTYTVTVTDANNCSETVSFTIVEPTFVHPPVATNQIFCLGQTSQLSDVVITGSNIKWYSSSTGGTLLPATTVLTNGTTYYASQTVGACESARIGVQITLGQGTPLTTTQLNVCSNTRVQNMTVDGFNYTQLKWFDTASSPTPLVASQLLSSKTYYVSSVVGNCESPRQAIQVTVAAAVSVPSASSQTVCGNTTLNDLVVNKDPGATLRWYNSLQSMNPLAGTTVVSTGTYYVQQVVGGCESTRVAVSIQVIHVNAPTMTSITTCAGVTVGDFNTSSSTYVWYTDATTTTALPTSHVLTTGNYYIAEEVSGCISARANVSVVVNARPASPTGALKQVFNFAATVADLQMVEPNVSWFASYQDALMQVNQLASNTRLQTGTTYYGILTGASNCGSLPTAVDVTIDLLGLAELDLAQLKYYPNPVESELNIDYIDDITKVEVFTITGQRVLSSTYNNREIKVDVSTLSSGTYMVRIETANASQFIKIVKK